MMGDAIGPLRSYDEATEPGPFAVLVRGWDVEFNKTVLIGPFASYGDAADAGGRTSAPSAIVIPLTPADTYWPGEYPPPGSTAGAQ